MILCDLRPCRRATKTKKNHDAYESAQTCAAQTYDDHHRHGRDRCVHVQRDASHHDDGYDDGHHGDADDARYLDDNCEGDVRGRYHSASAGKKDLYQSHRLDLPRLVVLGTLLRRACSPRQYDLGKQLNR